MFRLNQSLTPSSALPASHRNESRRPLWRRALKPVSIGVTSVLALTLASTLANTAITAAEKFELLPYGQTVTLDAGDVNVHRNRGSGPTMVMLSGYGTPAPAVDFAPLIRELDAFDVIVVEGFGYGYSDVDVQSRTIENITAELHEVLEELHIDGPVTLVGHSVGGIYARYYAEAYPEDVSAVIGIDPMAATTSSSEVGQPSTSEGVIGTVGLLRWASMIIPSLIQPPGSAFTDEERTRIAALTNWNYGNPSISDEWARIGANSTKANEHPFASDLPVLEVLSSESVDSMPDWLANHEAELAGVTTHQLEVLDGSHYLHWTQSPRIGRLISEFLAAHVVK